MKFSKRLDNITEYYFSRKLEEVRQLQQKGKDVINLAIGSPDMAPPDMVIDKLKQSADNQNNHSYQPYRSIKELRAAISVWYSANYRVIADPEKEILPLLGSKEGIFYISMALIDEGDEVLVPDPGYPAYSSAAMLAGGSVRYFDLYEENGWYPDLESIQQNDLSRVKLMWINYPNMPTGAKADRDVFGRLAEFGEKNNILIVNDNPYSMVFSKEQMSILESDNNKNFTAELNSMSKTYNMAGWRLGMLIASESLVNAVLQVKSNVDSGMFKPIQEAAITALGMDREWYSTLKKRYNDRKNLLYKLLDELSCIYSREQEGMFIWAKIPENAADSGDFIDSILDKAGVFIAPGIIFGNNGRRYIRVSLCAREERISEAIGRLKDCKFQILEL
jgi:aspartate/methionine/tyrosine aminotransferase